MNMMELKKKDRQLFNVIRDVRDEATRKKVKLSCMDRKIQECREQIRKTEGLDLNEVTFLPDSTDSSEEDENPCRNYFENEAKAARRELKKVESLLRKAKRSLKCLETYIQSKNEVPLTSLIDQEDE